MQRLKVGDLVQVIAGKDKGKRGTVKRILDGERVIVDGLNMVVRNIRPSQQNTEGGRVNKEASIHVSNVAHVDPKENKPTRVGYKTVDGRKVRFARRSGEMIDR